jgi:two-component system, HptB-dependent secretion and biofilm response regulator
VIGTAVRGEALPSLLSTALPRLPARYGTVRVLVADDSRLHRMLLSALLGSVGCEVLLACDGHEALEACEGEDPPDVVMLDCQMPGIDGFEVALRLRERWPDRHLPVLFMTASDNPESLSRAYSVGGDTCFSKPLDPMVVYGKLRSVLDRRDLYASLKRQRDELAAHEERRAEEFDQAHRVLKHIVSAREAVMPNVRQLQMPMATVNGDVALTAWGPGGNQVLMVGDLTGHGVPAAVGSVLVTEVFHAMTGRGFSGAEILMELNRKLGIMLPPGQFLAVALIEVARDQSSAAVWNAGLPDVVLTRRNGEVRRLPSRSVPLAVLDSDSIQLEVERLTLEPGDRIHAFTDGVTELLQSDGRFFGIEQVVDVLSSNASGDAIQALIDAQAAVRHRAEQHDDVSLLEYTCDPESVGCYLTSESGRSTGREPSPWRAVLELSADSLRRIEPVPVILQLLSDLQGSRADRGVVFTVLTEMFSNALEHGLLRLDSALKQGPDGFAHYYEERAARLESLVNASMLLEVGCRKSAEGHEIYVCVTHDGDGFDFRRATASAQPQAHGRGIPLIRALTQRLSFRDEGRIAEAVIRVC